MIMEYFAFNRNNKKREEDDLMSCSEAVDKKYTIVKFNMHYKIFSIRVGCKYNNAIPKEAIY